MDRNTAIRRSDMWREILRNYRVSNYGKVENIKTGKEIRQFEGKDGYMRTQIAGKTRLVHRLVAIAFIEKPEHKDFVNHIDGIKQNNNVNNLEWCTRAENMKHAYNHGLKSQKGIRNSRAILDENDVKYIREHYKRGDKAFGATALSKRFGVSTKTICAVFHRQTWNE